MRDLIDLRSFLQAHADETLVLCTFIHKAHYGYRAVGAKKLVTRSGLQCGLLSGGCLEGEIVRTALDEWGNLPLVRRFNTMEDADRFFGYQTGCPGIIDILFEHVPPAADPDLYLPFGLPTRAAGVAVDWSANGVTRSFQNDGENARFFDPWVQPIQLNIIGCGPDAPIFAEFVKPMGWSLRFFEYRSDAMLPQSCGFMPDIQPIEKMVASIPDGPLSAVLLMTHNYEADLAILCHLIERNFGYVGCLGPRRRYEQLKQDLLKLHDVTMPVAWQHCVHAPAGLFTSGRSPEEIALSVTAQIQSLLRPNERS